MAFDLNLFSAYGNIQSSLPLFPVWSTIIQPKPSSMKANEQIGAVQPEIISEHRTLPIDPELKR
ncbi:predicted protein [Uncinocarpus reesii 1704]|uniref:Uncharacterized protein n=1 Tax=Uncinocarpus reesii (strain UAMH 1704) TaxID=336963 RepID=C4JGB8_UNCRE|nr:uncharacterized protein UREG_02516 [Uncinocarpus reesii 1704]EEP77667.1 predicted protein [Uncinocarpus reesii 1704]